MVCTRDREYKKGGGVYELCDSVESVTRFIANCCVECVSRWVPVALSSVIDLTRSEGGGGGGSIHTIQWGNLHRVVLLTSEKYMSIYTVRGELKHF